MNTTLRGPALAAAILKNIDYGASPAFRMAEWFRPDDEAVSLAPDEEPACGTMLCAAGWAAHLTGWKLVSAYEQQWMTDGRTRSYIYAEKDGVLREISDAAQEALGLDDDEVFWYVNETTAVERLKQIASRPHGEVGR